MPPKRPLLSGDVELVRVAVSRKDRALSNILRTVGPTAEQLKNTMPENTVYIRNVSM